MCLRRFTKLPDDVMIYEGICIDNADVHVYMCVLIFWYKCQIRNVICFVEGLNIYEFPVHQCGLIIDNDDALCDTCNF